MTIFIALAAVAAVSIAFFVASPFIREAIEAAKARKRDKEAAAEKAARDKVVEDAIFGMFLSASDVSLGDSMLHLYGVESDWVALRMCGLDDGTRVRTLPADIRSKVAATSVEVEVVGARLVKEDKLRYMSCVFEKAKPFQNDNFRPPKGLFLLTQLGISEVCKQRAALNAVRT